MDFETRSEVNLKERGRPVYTAHPSTAVLLLSYAFDEEPIQIWEPRLGPVPARLEKAMKNPGVRKIAWNAAFERGVWADVLGVFTPPEEWLDVKVAASYLSITGSLEEVCEILALAETEAKIKEGRGLISLFSAPYCSGGEAALFGVTGPSFHDEGSRPNEWMQFREYCIRDTEVERRLFHLFEPLAVAYLESDPGWALDQKINEAGVSVALPLMEKALYMAEGSEENPIYGSKAYLIKVLRDLTGLENPNSRNQLLPWLQSRGYPFGSLNKAWVQKALRADIPKECKRALVLRQETSKTSYSKFKAIANRVSADGRLRDMFVYLGAARTGRWAGYGVQFQNLPRPAKTVEEKIDRALYLIDKADSKALVEEFVPPNEHTNERTPSVVGVVSSCIRSMFQAPSESTFLIGDFGSIENRVLGWLARCPAILDVYRKGQDSYLEFAANGMYKVSYDSLIKVVDGIHKPIDAAAAEKRQAAKPAVLGAGYELGHGTEIVKGVRVAKTHEDKWGNTVKEGLMAYAENMGVVLTPEESYLAVTAFRDRYPEVSAKPSHQNHKQRPGLWWRLESAAKTVIAEGGEVQVNFVTFLRKTLSTGQRIMIIKLPSGRCLHYFNARIEPRTWTDRNGNQREGTTIVYDGIGHGVAAADDKMFWGPVYTYGGKLTENVVQAISRDLLLHAMLLADKQGAKIVAHVHDEIICEAKVGDELGFSCADLKRAMSSSPHWTPGLPLAAEVYESAVYKKG